MSFEAHIALIFALLLISAFFSSSETAIFSLSRLQLKRQAEQNPMDNWFTNRMMRTPSRLLQVILIGNEVVNTATSVVVAAFCFTYMESHLPRWMVPVFPILVATPLLVIMGEILPKAVAIKIPEPIARLNSPFLYVFSFLVRPLQWLISKFVDVVLKNVFKISVHSGSSAQPIDEDTFRSMLDLGHSEGEVQSSEREMIHRILELDDITARSLMTPKQKVFTLEKGCGTEEAIKLIRETRRSRIPVHEGRPDLVTGVFYAKDLLRLWKQGRKSINPLVRPAFFVSPSDKVSEILSQFQDHRIHIAVVRDREGAFVGIITMQDILNHLFPHDYLLSDATERKSS